MQQRGALSTPARGSRRLLGPVSALVLGAGLMLSGCATAPGAQGDSAGVTEEVAAVALPQTTAGLQIQWMLDLLNADADIAPHELEGKFTKSFAEEAPAETVAEQMNAGVRPDRPYVVTGYQDVSDVLGAARITGASGTSLSLEMRVEEGGTIAEMLVRAAPKQ
ncbi:Cpe/LpqF family protein [Leucobacter sp. BZR 635]